MSWQKKFSNESKVMNDNFYEFICEYTDVTSEYFEEYIENIQNILIEYKYNGDKFENNVIKLKEGLLKLRNISKSNKDMYRDVIGKLDDIVTKHCKAETEQIKKCIEKCMPFIKSMTEWNNCEKRVLFTVKSHEVKFQNYKKDIIEEYESELYRLRSELGLYFTELYSEIMDKINEYEKKYGTLEEDIGLTLEEELDSISKYINSIELLKEKENGNEEEKVLNNFKLKKIFNYKEMESLAIQNGYKYKWANGDHLIYENEESKKIIVIPAHTLKKELSYKIQKNIYMNKEKGELRVLNS